MFKSKNPLVYVIVFLLVILMGAGGGYAASQLRQKPVISRNDGNDGTDSSTVTQNDAEPERDDADWEGTIEFNGQKYVRNKDITTVLFLGIDDAISEVTSGAKYGKGGRSDAMILFLLDKGQKTVKMLEISRDTMMKIDAYGETGKRIYSGIDHLAMQYSYGDSPARSCRLTKEKVSELLYGTKIDHHMSITISGVAAVVNELGGISVVMPTDYSYVNPSYSEGASVEMDADEVERFVRYRDTEETGSNDVRMERQNWFLLEVFRQMKQQQGEVSKLLDAAGPYLETDLDAATLQKMMDYSVDEASVKVPGETKAGEKHDEYYVDEAALQELLVDLFYLPAD